MAPDLEVNDPLPADDAAPRRRGHILVVDDEANIRDSLAMVLTGRGFTVATAGNGHDGEARIAEAVPDLIFLDMRLPGRSGLDLLQTWAPTLPLTTIVLISGEASVAEALEGLRKGAYDFIEKPLQDAKLVNVIDRVFERLRLLRNHLDQGSDDVLVAEDPAMTKLLALVARVAPTKARVLLTGESGTGKDLIARAIHRLSLRANQPFLKLNCAAIPAELVESELFGHSKGAFTGATAARKGVFETADGGTIFLDEIGEMPMAAQAKLLRVTQSGEFTPVGSNLTLKTDVRIIAATNRDLNAEVANGAFREDLMYRLAVVCLESPPLRQRPGDIRRLSTFFAEAICKDYGFPPRTFAPGVFEIFEKYPWPGNVRELKNVIERLMILAGAVVEPADLPESIRSAVGMKSLAAATPNDMAIPCSWTSFKARSERAFVVGTLKHCDGNVSETARVMGVERQTVHKWIKAYGILKGEFATT